MKFNVEKKGELFMVVNDTTGDVKGRFKTEGEAKLAARNLQREHTQGVEMVSARLTPKREDLPSEVE